MQFPELVRLVKEQKIPVAAHSGEVRPGGAFVALPAAVPRERAAVAPGGEAHIAAALAASPGYIVCEPRHVAAIAARIPVGSSCVPVIAESPRQALGLLAQALYDTDECCPTVVGITGTNGKTTQSCLLERIYVASGHSVGVIGTVEYRWPGGAEEASLTTPGCLKLHSLLARMRDAGVDTVFMEVASHALDQERVAGIAFSGVLLTNVTQDHLDYHGDMDSYFHAKARLFQTVEQGGTPLDDKVRACNADDPYGRRILTAMPGSVGYGLHEDPAPGTRHLRGVVESISPSGMHLSMEFEGRRWELSSPLVGDFNAMNLLGAQALALGMGAPPEAFSVLEGFTGVRGRLERVPNTRGVNVFVDYAHTPDALVNVLRALRAAGFARVITVFGCGGNRDATKRPRMGEAVARYSDVAILTSDNPRHEKPEAIMADVLPGLAGCPEVHADPDRRAALALALALAGPEDALLVAGKGHETYQQIGDVKIPFSDQAILRELMA
jgi:UDP-N-acetylmuramoyl-L-alanyl-D-glutamate--2,6-diaminopimelate ligase